MERVSLKEDPGEVQGYHRPSIEERRDYLGVCWAQGKEI